MHFQGPVPLDDPSYADRAFEEKLIREIQRGRWVLLLGPRQHGKTSAMLRVQKTLTEGGTKTAFVDFQNAPPTSTYSEFVRWVCQEVYEDLNSAELTLPASDSLGTLIAQALPAGRDPIVILIDEASNIHNPDWRTHFYGQLRAIANKRAVAAPEDAATRIRFVFSGTFSPETLIDDANSPFNVSERIDTDDLTEAKVLALSRQVLGEGHDDIGQAIFAEVGGQPFLVQRLLSQVNGMPDPLNILEMAIEDLRTGDSDHINHLFRKFLAVPTLKSIIARMVSEGDAPNEPGDHDYKYLQVLGIARRDGRKLVFRNSLYRHVAVSSPQLGGDAAGAERVPIFALPIDAFDKIKDDKLREIAWSAHNGAVAAYRGGSNRLALAGFGGSIEAVILDLLLRLDAEGLRNARAGCRFQRPYENENDPRTWRFVNLMKAARQIANGGSLDTPEALREWRNTIHPSVCLNQYLPDEQLDPEARAAAALHAIVLRDLN